MCKIQIPTECPFCGTKTEMQDSRLLCPNVNCPETIANRLAAFSEGLGILGVAVISARKIVEYGITTPLMLIKTDTNTLVSILGENGRKLRESFVDIREENNRISDIKFLNSLTIPNVSTHTAELILSKFKIEDLYNPFGSLSVDLTTIDGVGEITQASVAKYFQENEQMIRNLMLELNPIHNIIKVNENSPIKGFGIVITGTLKLRDGTLVQRPDFKEMLISNGASLKSSVSKKTSLLVVGEAPGAAKIKQAEENGVKIVNSEEFLNLVEDKIQGKQNVENIQ